MRKNLLSVSLVGILALISLNSCRSNDEFIQQNSEYTNDSRFSAFWVKNKDETIDFAKAFKEVLTDYSEISGKELYGVKPKGDGSYVNFKVFSQTIALDQGGYAVLFPIVKNFKTSGILMASIDKDARKLGINLLDPTMDEYSVIVKSMDNRLSANLKLSASVDRNLNLFAGTDCTKNPDDYDCTIDPVVVPGKPKPKPEPDGPDPGPPIDPNPGTEPTCSEVYGMSQNTFNAAKRPPLNCTLPGGGNPGTPTPTTDGGKDGCSKMKAQRNEEKFKKGIEDLKGKTGLKKETGYTEDRNGDYVYQENADATENANSLHLPDAKKYNIINYMHTHVDDYTDSNGDLRQGIKMFSPADVVYFMDMLQNAKDKGIAFSEISGTMVTSNGTYTIRFSGNEYQLKSFTEEQSKAFTNPYRDFMTENADLSLEQKFLQFIDSKMNIKGIELFKLNEDGTNTKTVLMSNKTSVNSSNCD